MVQEWTLGEKMCRAMLESASQAIVVVDEAGRIRFANAMTERLFGFERAEILGEPIEVLIPERFREIHVAHRSEYMDDPRTRPMGVNMSLAGLRSDGSEFPIEVGLSFTRQDGRLFVMTFITDVTARAQAEAALRRSEQLYQAIAGNLPQSAILLFDHDLRYMLVEGEALETAGYTQEEMIGRTIYDVWSDDIITNFLPLYRAALAGEEASFERAFRDRVYLLHVAGIRDETGEIFAGMLLVQDITQMKEAERALRESEARYRGLVETQQDMIVRVNAEGAFTFVNDAYCEKFGGVREELLGTPFDDFLNAQDTMVAREALAKLDAPPHRIRIEQQSPTREGDRWISWEGYAIRDEEGRIIEVQAVGRDITESKLAHKRLERLLELENLSRETAARFLQAEDSDEPIHQVLAMVGQFLDVSRAYVFHFREHERLLDNTHEWCAPGVHPEIGNLQAIPYDEVFPSFLPTLSEQSVIAVEHISEFPDDLYAVLEPQGIESVAWVTFYVNGRLQGMIGFDETRGPRIWYPETISTLHAIADNYGRALERERAQAALIEARDAALDSVRVKSTFMSNMSHEIRTPMTGILGMLELLRETELDEEQREFADTAFSSAKSLLNIVNDILDFSKLEAGRIVLEVLPVDLRGLVAEIAATMGPQAQKKDIGFKTDIAEDVPARVLGDPTRLRQIVANLVSNAIKFTDWGGVRVNIRALSRARGRMRLRFEVSDTGVGIEPDQLNRIFESFVQADGSTTRKYGGTGLGLAISRQLIELMGGEIDVASEPDRGSTFGFTITVPVSTGDEREPALESLRVLVVDEERTALYIMAQQLRLWHVQVDEASESAQAVQMLSRAASEEGRPFDVVLIHCKRKLSEQERLIDEVREKLGDQMPVMVRVDDEGTTFSQERSGFGRRLVRPIRQSDLYDVLIDAQMEPEAPLPMQEDPPRLVPQPEVSFGRILLAEDNMTNQRIVTKALRQIGYHVDVAENGREALNEVEANDYDLILMDIHMPEMDGLAATRAIRALGGTKGKTPIVALTASVLPEEQKRYLEAGMEAVWSKPFSVEGLRANVRARLARDR